MKNKKKKKQEADIEDWVKLVHESACCSYDPSLDEEKALFIKKLEQGRNTDKNTATP